MIITGYISHVNTDEKGLPSYKVWIPAFSTMEFEKLSDENDEGLEATVSCMPNSSPNFKVGDTVIVAFERYDVSNPIIIGWLFGSKDNRGTKDKCTTYPDIVAHDLTVMLNATLPQVIKYKTSDDKTVDIDLSKLSGIKDDPLQKQIDLLSSRCDDLEALLEEYRVKEEEIYSYVSEATEVSYGYYSPDDVRFSGGVDIKSGTNLIVGDILYE